ncbi:Adenine DNA glycosylase [Tepidimonas alkaliphilus]|uniref:Adenine DNA glycosylase n=1 Tax=Tepidimonas alkaliphilus TaxID=2588942 RepID=A0A554W5W4_9BURK|nr:A/G-specific adenine glycosylase [Tepidimonas alkaliphilus]TSE18977.1 Adenine DNA glycosylase [Tepidimonas alkaliphilus]
MSAGQPSFFERLVAWQRACGRHDLPWQGTRDPYRVWLSEIMLQQTQVATVRRYYEAFLARFADVQALARAPLDEVLAAWSGLGYYRRARLLHAAARQVVERLGGRFPHDFDGWRALPGVGDSTAAAIAAFCHGQPVSILDGNVRRVLQRWSGAAGAEATPRALWRRAQALLPPQPPAEAMAAYTQGLMDLGATVCTPRQPRCPACPLRADCAAHAGAAPLASAPPRRAARRAEAWWLPLWVRADGALWLQRRPARGIWAGLWAPPVLVGTEGEQALRAALATQPAQALRWLPPLAHALTHRDLTLHRVQLRWDGPDEAAPDGPGVQPDQGAWWTPSAALALGLPAPVRAWLAGAGPASRTSSSR